jgi:hypothetical protein
MKKLFILFLVFGASTGTFAATEDQVIEVMKEISPLLYRLKTTESVEVGQCYLGTDKLIRMGTLPASEFCIAVGLQTEDQLSKVRDVFTSPLKVHGVAIAFEVVGPTATSGEPREEK